MDDRRRLQDLWRLVIDAGCLCTGLRMTRRGEAGMHLTTETGGGAALDVAYRRWELLSSIRRRDSWAAALEARRRRRDRPDRCRGRGHRRRRCRRITNLVGIGLIVAGVIFSSLQVTFRATLGGNANDPSPGTATPTLGRTVRIPTEGAVTDPAEVRRLLHEHGVEVSEEAVQRAMREGGEVSERSVTITYSGEEPHPTTAITWNGPEIDQAAVLAGGHPARARVVASNDRSPDLRPRRQAVGPGGP